MRQDETHSELSIPHKFRFFAWKEKSRNIFHTTLVILFLLDENLHYIISLIFELKKLIERLILTC